MSKDAQPTFATAGFDQYAKPTRRSEFLAEMDKVVPWQALLDLIEPHYPTGDGGRPSIELKKMLRIYFVQQWYNLSDPAAEEAMNDSCSVRSFVGVDLGKSAAPDETTICKFRHLLKRHAVARPMLAAVNQPLSGAGYKVTTGTIVDATIIHAPTSTKNQAHKRDPEMHSTRKGTQWYHGMKAHIGVDSKLKITHSVTTTAATVHDSQVLGQLLHGNETCVWGDAAYRGHGQLIRTIAPAARDYTHRQGSSKAALSAVQRAANHHKSSVRCKVEHVFAVIKRVFGFDRVRYRGLAKNEHRLIVTCALANLFVTRKRLLRLAGA